MDGGETMRRRLLAIAALAACQSSFAPDPALIGNWEVTFDTLSKGSLAPNPVTVTVGQTQNGYTATIPSLTWVEPAAGGAVFDSGPGIAVLGHTITFRLFVGPTNSENCRYVLFGGQLNAAKDSVPAGEVDVYDPASDMNAACFGRGNATLVKQ